MQRFFLTFTTASKHFAPRPTLKFHSHRCIFSNYNSSLRSSRFFCSNSDYKFRTIESDLLEPTLYKDKGSKFLTYAYQINNEAEFKAGLAHVKSEHPRSTHHCYAYRYKSSPHQENSRANDDGEPSGSAGLPILNRLISKDIMNVLIVVVRYYGGINLGVAGLIKAYRESAELALNQSTIIDMEFESTVIISFDDFQLQSTLFQLLGTYNAETIDFECDEISGAITAKIKLEFEPQLQRNLLSMNGVRMEILK